jgi:hypothetical protein
VLGDDDDAVTGSRGVAQSSIIIRGDAKRTNNGHGMKCIDIRCKVSSTLVKINHCMKREWRSFNSTRLAFNSGGAGNLSPCRSLECDW